MRQPRTIQEKKKGRAREPFAMIPFKWLDLPAWRHLNGNAVKLLMHLWRMSGGDNGAHGARDGLFLSERDAAKAIGCARNTASGAFALLMEAGWVRSVQKGHFSIKAGEKELRATVWRLTFQSYPQGRIGPTGEYLRWQPEENSRAQNLNGSGSKIEPVMPGDAETGAEFEPVVEATLSEARDSSRSIIEPHIDIAIGKRAKVGRNGVPQPVREPISTPQNAGGPNSADPFASIRQRVRTFCDGNGKAEIAALARRVGLDPADVKGFGQGRTDLDVRKIAALRTETRAAA